MKEFWRQRTNRPSGGGLRKSIMIYGTAALAMAGIAVWGILHVLQPTPPQVEAVLDASRPAQPSEVSSKVTLPSPSPPLPKKTRRPAPQLAPSRSADKPSAAVNGPTVEQRRHYERTQAFVSEARKSLPLIGIRAYNPLESRMPSGDGSTAAPVGESGPAAGFEDMVSGSTSNSTGAYDNSQHDEARSRAEASSAMRDNRGLKDGEVWIRIDPARAAEHQEIMAHTADLYRANTGFDGDVKVILWTGSRPWVSKTFSSDDSLSNAK